MKSFRKFVGSRVGISTLAVASMFAFQGVASAQPALSPDLGVDIAAWVPVVAAAFGNLVAACLSVYFLLQIIKGGMSMIKRTTTR